MRIGIVTTWFERGAAYVSRQYRDVLRAQGNEVFIYARSGEQYAIDHPQWDGPDVTWGKPFEHLWVTAIDLEDFTAWIHAKSLDYIIFNEQHWFPAVLKARELGVKTAAYIDYYKEDTIPFFALYDMLLCNTRRHYSAFDWHTQCLYFPWGTDLELFRPPVQIPVGKQMPVFFHSAGMNPLRKGTDLVLRAFSSLQNQAHLIIHTQIPLNVNIPGNTALIEHLQAQGRLTIYEGDVAAPGLYHLGDVYVYPSRLEGIGLTQAEALACGLPLIVPDWPPMNEFISGDNGMTVAVDRVWSRADGYYWPQCQTSIASLAGALKRYIEKFSTLASARKQARTYAEKHLDWVKNTKNLSAHMSACNSLPVDKALVDRVLSYFPQSLPESDWERYAKRHPFGYKFLKSITGIGKILLGVKQLSTKKSIAAE